MNILEWIVRSSSSTSCIAGMGWPGKRYSLPNANIMIHQILGGAEGQATDVEIRVRYMLKLKQRLNGIISKHTGKSIDQVKGDIEERFTRRYLYTRLNITTTGWKAAIASPGSKVPSKA